MGQTAVFFVEFTLDEDLEMPLCGIEIVNERHIVLHGKNSLQHGSLGPSGARRGSRVRLRQRMTLSIAEGRYSFALGLATISPADAAAANDMSYAALSAKARTILVVADAGTFSVMQRKHGHALPFHGLCDLPGDARVIVRTALPQQPFPASDQVGIDVKT